MFFFKKDPSHETLARMLHVRPRILKKAAVALERAGMERGIVASVYAQEERRIDDILKAYGLSRASSAHAIEEKLLLSVDGLNMALDAAWGHIDYLRPDGAAVLGDRIRAHANNPKGFFLKKDAFIRMLRKNPPQRIMQLRGHASVDDLIAKEDVMHIGAALRFVEDTAWLNGTFFEAYADLTPDDFEERPVQIIPLDPSWEAAAAHFVQKKYHNISHLKELGIIFIIPTSQVFEGQFLRTVLLLLHYVNEISFYSSLFRMAAGHTDTFARQCMSLLRGDVLEDKKALPKGGWLIDQRYLEKGNESDWRLFVPRVNPEALHWMRAERMLQELSASYPALRDALAVWKDTGWVGDFFPASGGKNALVSFNIIDASMSLVRKKDDIAYTYHLSEALWNAIFMQAMGEEKTEQLIKEHIIRGYITL